MVKNQKRVIVANIIPQLNGGQYAIKRVVNEIVSVNADLLADGHDMLAGVVQYKHQNSKTWKEANLKPNHNGWDANFVVEKQGFYEYKVTGWVDYALTWQHGIKRKIDDNQKVSSELLEGIHFLKYCSKKATVSEKEYLMRLIQTFSNTKDYDAAIFEATSDSLHKIFTKYPEKKLANSSKVFKIYVDRLKARFSTWYEFFPRSASQEKGVHGTFKDCEKLLPRVVEMGFDTLYFPPIHPIGRVNRKGKNNTEEAFEGDVGSCWGIGAKEGGHKDIHSELGSVQDFKSLIKKADKLGIEMAMDYALQAAPDHPWVTDHPSWFKWRPDGTVQYAENPPKKYQDILPIYWESKDYKELWEECLDTLLYWISCGIKIFRVDNPHTKPFYFWNWIIAQVKEKHPDVIFLAEAFTAPKIMEQLAKEGFTQSYTYFTWRENKHELTQYIEELTKSDQSEYMQPNFWPNTPDINPFHLQGANESKYMQRYVLAATLSSSIGIYGPVFEQMIDNPIPGREEYWNSEKFQICDYNWFEENKLIYFISKINAARKVHTALQQTKNIRFCNIQNDNLMAFYKWDDQRKDELLIIVNLDCHNMQSGMLQLPLYELQIGQNHHIIVEDLITKSKYDWYNEWNYIELHPSLPFHIFKINK